MSTTVLDAAVIGAGAAGLTVARRLADRGIRFEIFDDHAHVGDTWRERYRSLRLFTPRRYAELRGLKLPIGFFDYPSGSQFADYLERYAERFALPVRSGTRVRRLSRDDDGRFRLELAAASDGAPAGVVVADRVIVAAGAHRVPVRPAFAVQLSPAIHQLHSLDYLGPEQFADGPVLVVGAANSGTDIALEAAATGHRVVLAGRHPGHVPVDIDTPIGNLMSGFFITRLHALTIDTEKGRKARDWARGHGVRLVRNSPRDLERAGIVQVARVASIDENGDPCLADGTPIDAATVVWSTGSRPDLGWLAVDGVLGEDGWPAQYRGIVDAVPGIAFVGLPFQYAVTSPTLMGMDRDAAYVVDVLFGSDATGTHPGRRAPARATA